MNWVNFSEFQWLNQVPDMPGIYAFCGIAENGIEEGPIYVGMAENLRRRIGQHERENHVAITAGGWVEWFPVPTWMLRHAEAAALAHFNPRLNKTCGTRITLGR